MISIKTQTNLAHAKTYFRNHLATGDYYQSDGATPGQWLGKGAGLLGLQGQVIEKDFLALCKGEKPNGTKLTQRKNTVREGDTANRRIFYDWTICPPKSVSIAALVHNDTRIKDAHARAIATATAELEQFAAARVRSKLETLNGKDRSTGNLICASFTHETSRAVDEVTAPDPLLHSHLLVFNATKDGEDWKALQTFEMLRAQKYVEAVYDHELCRELSTLGYGIRETRAGWELANISDETCQKFSKRRVAILEKTEELEKAGAKTRHENLKDHVAHDARIRKSGSMTGEALRASWIHQMNDKEMEYNNLYSTVDIIANNATPQTALNWSLKHLFERSAVVRDTDLLSSALRSARGGNFSVDALKSEFEQNPYILRELGGRRVTTQDALETEQYILRSVKDGQGQYQPLASGLLSSAEKLNPLQLQAAASLLSSRDLVTIFRGGAGTGKSFTLRHIVDALAAAGKQVVILAPQNQQVVDLTRDGFKNGQTVSTFLGSPLQLDPNSVMIVDEAGQIGGQDMATLIAKAKVAGARLILSGDTRQHGAVAASDALQAIERYANPHCAELVGEKAIQRQQEAVYRQAVASAERGDTEAAWDLLDKQGAIKETTIAARTADAAALYVEKMATGSVLMLSQTNVEVEQLNSAIREKLITAGKLDPASEISNTTLRAVDLTNAEKEQARSYFENSIVQLNRKLGNVAAGSQARFLRENGNGGVILSVAGQVLNVSQKDLSKLTICEEKNLKLCRGDKIQLKANCTLSRNSKLANGQILTVRGVDETGGLLVTDAYEQKFTLPSDFRQFQLGYAVSSYSAQGKTVDHVIISDSQCKAATSQKEFYVSISRGRKSCSILTSDRETLQDHIQRLGTRDLASDLTLDPSRQAAHGWHGDARMVVSPSMLRGFLGHAGARKMPWGIDLETGEKVDLFGNSVGLLAVRGLAKLVQVILRCVAGMFRAKEVERAAENSR